MAYMIMTHTPELSPNTRYTPIVVNGQPVYMEHIDNRQTNYPQIEPSSVPVVEGIIQEATILYTKPMKSYFVFIVLNIVTGQIIITFIIDYLIYYYKHTIVQWLFQNPSNYNHNHVIAFNNYWNVMIILITSSLVSMLIMYCFRENKWLKYPAFGIFTISTAITLGIGLIPYNSSSILLSLISVFIIIFITNCSAFYHSRKYNRSFTTNTSTINISPENDRQRLIYHGDFNIMPTFMVSISVCFLSLALINLIFMNTWSIVMLSLLGATLFSAYIFYDLNILYSREGEDFCDDPVICAINLYLDIVNLFQWILCMLGFDNTPD